mmetsp:Transcript_53899/g.115764  ORF Transcript_53899/g.115764 Transcript_53899/m.115764 type:complete len:431 (+) Transcript_53899:117-1409(+)
MELSVLEVTGAPSKALLAISSGSVRRTSDLAIGQPMLIPVEVAGGDAKLSISLLKHLGSAVMPGDLPDKEIFAVPIAGGDGKEVKLQATRRSAPSEPPKASESEPAPKEPWHYLGYQEIQNVVQRLFDEVLRDRPAEPYKFMADRLRALKTSGDIGKAAAATPKEAECAGGAATSLFEGRASKCDIRADSDVLKSLACDAIMKSYAEPAGSGETEEARRTSEAYLNTIYNAVDDGTPPPEGDQVAKIHSAIRWNKSIEEIEQAVKEAGASLNAAVRSVDSKTGNYCLHIAAQNGHKKLVEFLLAQKADVNAQNKKGQTPLHMSIEYDFYFQSKALLAAGANPELQNGDGHKAKLGIDGGKSGAEAWDNPVTILKAVTDTKDELEVAYTALETADIALIDKGSLAQAGIAKKKACSENWDANRFMKIMQRL